MNLQEKVNRGARAREVIENEEFQRAFELIEQELTEAWKTSPQRDAEGREKIHQCITMLNKVKAALEQTMDSGKLALLQLNHDNPTWAKVSREWLDQ